MIRELYDIERDATERGLDVAGRKALRTERAPPILESLEKWVKKTSGATLPKSELGRALTFLSNQWSVLQRFVEGGALDLDNNACEKGAAPDRRLQRGFSSCDPRSWQAELIELRDRPATRCGSARTASGSPSEARDDSRRAPTANNPPGGPGRPHLVGGGSERKMSTNFGEARVA